MPSEIEELHTSLRNVLDMLIQERGLDDFDSEDYHFIEKALKVLAKHKELPVPNTLVHSIRQVLKESGDENA